MPTMPKTRTIAVAGFLLASLLLVACKDQKSAEAPAPPPPPEVAVVTVQPQRVAITTELSGRTAPHQIAEVRPQVSGIIQRRLFTEGAEVKAGAPLYQIDPATYQAAYDNAAAAVAMAEAALLPARLKAERLLELVKINAVSQQEYDEADAAFKLAQAEVAAARAALASARINLDYTTVKAPIAGRIGPSLVTTGALVTANQAGPLATIQELDPIYVDVTQSTADLLRLKRELASGRLQQPSPSQAQVHLQLADGSAYPLPGTLKFSDVSVNQGTGSVTLRMLFPNPEQLLLPGMFVRALLEEGIDEEALLVPQRGVTRNPAGNAMVMLVGAEEKVEARVIEAARTVGDSWLVSSGLQPGDRVILEGTQRARPGTAVKAVPFGAKEGDAAPAAK